MAFDRLDPARILETAEQLAARVSGRFPGRGLSQVALELRDLCEKVTAETSALTRPLWVLRILVAFLVLAGAAVFILVGTIIPLNQIGRETLASVERLEATINTLLLAGLGLAALIQVEARVKRRRVLRGLHRLRSIIHVIDMHQLTKDPVALTPEYAVRAESPKRDLTAPELERYLDYCSEMLAVTGKLAALYAQAVPDEGVANAVNDIETLGSNLSRKIWQKIVLIEGMNAKTRAPRTKRSA
jgi:hypothetical protein